MTSSAHKLGDDPIGESSLTDLHGKIAVLETLDDFIRTIAIHPKFRSFQITTRDSDMVTISRDGLGQTFLFEPCWAHLERRLPFLDQARGDGHAVICVGTAKDLDNFPEDLRRPNIQQLGVPISELNLYSVINSIHNLLTMTQHSRAEALEIEEANNNVKYMLSISRELNGERDIPKLLTMILGKARDICSADAGSIYTVDSPTQHVKDGTIQFRLTQNHSIKQNLTEFSMPVNEGSIVGNVCLHEVTINIPDLYKLSPDHTKNPYGARHDRTWDQRIGYESHSMLAVPMFDISHNVIGVIQLINRKQDRTAKLTNSQAFQDQVIPFDEIDQEVAEIVAQQAGIALENANMQQNIRDLFDGFVNASVTAIEQRDPTTSGHSHRVAHLTVELAKVVNRIDTGTFRMIHFNDDQLQEIRYASLLHDFGKLGVRENVLVKAKKLYPWEMDKLLLRFDLIRASVEIDYLKRVIEYLQSPDHFPMGASALTFEFEKNQKILDLDDALRFIVKANEPTVLEQGGFERLKDIASLAFKTPRGEKVNYLQSDELKALSVSRGSLTREEFAEIQSHVTHTYEFLRKIPWGKKLANVPQIAAKHHEKLDGTGYPTSAEAEEIPLQTRMMTISDIFDALTAADRPYKRAVPVDRALDILETEVKAGKIDAPLFQLFCESKVFEPVLDPNYQFSKI